MNATRKLVALLTAAALLMIVMVVASFQSFTQVAKGAAVRSDAYDLLIGAHAVLDGLTDAEAGQRGFIATGNAKFLEPYESVRDRIRSQLGKMRPLVSNSDAQKLLETMTPLINDVLTHMDRTIESRRRQALTPALALAHDATGNQLMHSIRSGMGDLLQLEKRLLDERDATLQESLRRLFGVIVTGSLFTLLFGFLFAYLIYRDMQNRTAKLLQVETQRLLDVQEDLNRELQEANATLRVNEEKLAVTLNSIGDAVITTDEVGNVTLLNPLAENLTGWSLKEAHGHSVAEVFRIIDQDTRQPSIAPVMDTLEKGTQHGLATHTVLIARNGSESTIADSCAPIRERDGRVMGAVLVFRDVTNEDAARQALRDQQFYTRSLIESSIDALMTTDPAGIISDANKQMEMLTGCTRDELIGSPFKTYFTDPARAEAGISQVLREGRISNYELTARSRNGKQTAVSYNATTFHNRKRVLQGVVAAARDVTERKVLDQVLQEKNHELEGARSVAERANLAKSNFLSSMSHELRTPLNAILGFAQLMSSSTPPPSAAQKRSVDQILKAGWYLLELINEILDLALIESGKLTMSREPVSLGEVMLECRAMIEPQARERGIAMVFPQFDVPHFVHADRTRIKQVLINLTFNAIKYNRPQGNVAVEYSMSAPDLIRISVRDTGDGLAPEQLAQLFQPFNRLGRETGGEEGTGMGLVVSKRLVELMGGTIGADSVVGVGSVFWIELSLTTAPQLTQHKAEPVAGPKVLVPADSPTRTLLYVEDNPANLELVEQLIARRPDLRLLSAADGIVGVALARAQRPEVVLMDINLPGISGIEALAILRLDQATAHIPVIALSANAMPRDIEKGLDAGFFSYLTKPIKVDEFMAALDVALLFAESEADRTTKEAKA